MILKLWVAFTLMLTAALCQSDEEPETRPVHTDVEEKLDILFKRLTIVENIVENMNADVLKLRNTEEKCCAVDDGHGIKDIKQRLIDVEGKLNTSTPQVDYLGNQVKKIWGEVRDIRSKGAVPKANHTLRHEVPSTTHSKEEERKEGTGSGDLITDAITNSTHTLNEMLSNLKYAARYTLDNSLYEMINSKDELGNELSYLERIVRDALSNYTTRYKRISNGHIRFSYSSDLEKEERELKSILSQSFRRVLEAIRVNFKNLKQMMTSKFSNFSDEINNSRDASRKAFSNLRECHCKRPK